MLPRLIVPFITGIREMGHVAHGMESLAESHGILIGTMAKALDESGAKQVEYAKALIGHYEHEGNWPQLAEATQVSRVQLGFPPNEPLLREGTLRDSYDHEVEEFPTWVILTVGSDDYRAAITELGSMTQPPRPVLTPTANAFILEVEGILGEKVELAMVTVLDLALHGEFINYFPE
jgi:hypothetical protein